MPQRASLTYDDELLALSDSFPEFSGLYLTQGGELVVRAVGARLSESARDAIARFLAARMDASEAQSLVDRTVLEASVYRFVDLYRWRDLIAKLPTADVRTLDLDERLGRVAVSVAAGTDTSALRDQATSAGIPRDALTLSIAGRIELDLPALTSRQRPTLPGYELTTTLTGTDQGCTLGWRARRSTGTGALFDTLYFATNSHCTSTLFGIGVPDNAGQPSLATLDRLGVEVADPAPFTAARDPRCPAGYYCRYSDAAIFRYAAGVTATAKAMADASGSGAIQTAVPGKLYGPPVGATVIKTGWVTGTTSGAITQSCVDIDYPAQYLGSPIRLICQHAAMYASDNGDSGSPVRIVWAGLVSATGIHWARNSATQERYFSQLSGIENDMGVFVLHE